MEELTDRRVRERASYFGEAADGLVTNTIGHTVLSLLARGETLSLPNLMQDLMQRADAGDTMDARLAKAACIRLMAE